jgi:YD repeat-containing protein
MQRVGVERVSLMAIASARVGVCVVVGCITLLFAPCGQADSVSYSYDEAGRLVRAEFGDGGVIEYAYDEAGNRLSRKVTRPAGAPDIEIEPTSHDFGSVTLGGQSTAQRFTVTSAGTEGLMIGTVAVNGDDAGSFVKGTDTCSGQTVAPASSCRIDVVFKPSATGSKTATLSVPSNDPDEGPEVATLTGNGVAVPTPGACVGDCNGGGEVTVDELILCVNIALGNQPVDSCRNCDTSGDGMVTVDELVRAVNAALSGCDRAGTLRQSR